MELSAVMAIRTRASKKANQIKQTVEDLVHLQQLQRILQLRSEYCRMDSESADSSSQPQTNDMKSHSMANNVEPPVKAYDIERPKAFARFTSGLGLRLQSMNLPPDNHAEPTSTGTQTVLESFKKGIADSSCSEGCAGQNTPYGFPKQKKIPGILTVLFMNMTPDYNEYMLQRFLIHAIQEGEFDLDMTYITENIIAMGFPAGDLSSGLLGFFEGFYRNKMEEVIKLF
ncbi:hypothetical protein V6N11_063050 [Hibiscus sabdariffa]|uniref:Uncharacterized protein n=1 Tax=Hibiscus sabdariffa TaxID=183260 RepID=A0ABR2NPZ9_9ROSI